MTCEECLHFEQCEKCCIVPFDENDNETDYCVLFVGKENFVSRKEYDELRGKYEHLKCSMQLVSSIKQTEEN